MICRRNTVQNTTVKPFTSTSRRVGRTVSRSNGWFFPAVRCHTDSSTTPIHPRTPEATPVTSFCGEKCGDGILTSSGNPSQRRCPVPLCSQSHAASGSFVHPVAHRSAGVSAACERDILRRYNTTSGSRQSGHGSNCTSSVVCRSPAPPARTAEYLHLWRGDKTV